MEFQFALILQNTDSLGWILSPFEIVKEDGKTFFQVSEYLTPETNKKYLAPHEQKIVSLLANCEESALYKRYNVKDASSTRKMVHKKDEPKDFLFKIKERDKKLPLKEQQFEGIIRPYVEKNLAEAFLLAKDNNVPIYNKIRGANFYPEDKIEICMDKPDVTFIFEKRADGFLERYLRIIVGGKELKLFNQQYLILSNSPNIIKIGTDFYYFPDIEASKLKAYFTTEKPVTSPSYLQQTFDGFVLNCIKNYKVIAKGFEITDVYEKPVISAAIVKNIKNDVGISFSFRYGNWIVTDVSSERNFFVDYQYISGNPKYKRIQRDREQENIFLKDVEATGLVGHKGFWICKNADGDEYMAVLDWIQKNKKLLDAYHVEVFDEADQKIQNFQARLEMDVVSESIDWFDVHAVVIFGEYKIPFKKLRKNILNEDPVVQLPNNQIGIIPTEWFAKYKELFLFSTKNGTQEYFSVRAVHYKTIQRLPIQLSDSLKTRLLHIETNGLKDNDVPKEINAQLRPYQIEGYRWLCFLHANKFGGCLADDMGLGKTLQTIALLQKVINIQKETGEHKPSLIVSPASIVYNWYNEFEKFAPHIKVFKYVGNERNKSFMYFNDYDVILTTYGLLRNDIESFEEFEFYYIVLDESQMIKNPGSKIYSSVLKLKSVNKLLLTGTPIENTLTDLWAQLNFVNRDMLGSLKFFKEYFVKGIERHDENVSTQLKRIIKPFIFRREKQEVAKDLPAMTSQVRYCKMSDAQAKIYETEKSKVRNMIFETIEKETFQKSTINVLQALMKLRLIANHPMLAEGHGSSGKFDEVLRMLPNIIHHHKVLIFSSFVRHLDLFRDHFKKEGIKFSYLVGSTQNRESVIKDFQEDENCKIFLISIKAGGVGLNLTQADYVFILDPWWNPAVEDQAISRAHRIGQKNNVTVYRFISENTIEEKIQMLQQRKSMLASNFVPDEQTIPFSQDEISFLVG